jgi:3'-5' exonuclease
MQKVINTFIDLETLPQDGTLQDYIDEVKESIKVPSDLTKPKLIEALGYGSDAKYKTVDELKSDWIERFGTEQSKIQGEHQWRKTALDGAKGEICVIGSAIENDAIVAFSQLNMSESEMIRQFWQWMDESIGSSQWRLVAHNAKFDVPYLWHRSVILGIKPSMWFNPHGRHCQSHYCTMEAWAGFNGRISLDNLAKALGVKGKSCGIDGSMVYDTWLTEKESVIEYCKDDVRVLREIYNRMEFL